MAEVPVPRNPMNANAQIGQPVYQSLDEITVAATKTQERAIDALAPVSVVTLEQIQGRQATRVGDLVYNIPGVWLQDRGDDPSTSINIRGLQDFGRVAVVVDGARQNYQRTGHNSNGSFFLNPELIGGIDIVRGPTANIYGSGAIGGVASFRTKDIQDVVRPGERWGVDTNTVFGTNSGRALGSVFGGVHVNPNVDVFAGGTYSTQNNYKDGLGIPVENTAQRLSSGIAKLTVRPADGHEIKLGGIFQEDIYNVGQPRRPIGQPFAQPGAAGNGTSVYATNLKNYTTTLGWKYSRPDDQIFDWDAKIYWNRTDSQQVKTLHNSTAATGNCIGGQPGNSITGCVGDQRSYLIDTFGFDVHNTSRFETGDWRHAITYGGDGFRDDVSTADKSGNSNKTTPGGERTVTGAFVQWKTNYTSLLEVVGAIRYDNYQLSSSAGSASGDRFSPKITIGLLPASVVTPYVSYAEGYRAPSITETLVDSAHVATGTGQGDFSICPDGTRGFFCFLPNPNLRPEVGKTKEIGVNIKKNDLFRAGDSFRGKLNVFRNDVDDYIDSVQFTRSSVQYLPAVWHVSDDVSSVSEHCACPHPGLRSRDDVRCQRLFRWRVVDAAGRQEHSNQHWPVQHPATEGDNDRRSAFPRQSGDPVGDVDVGEEQHRYSGHISAGHILRPGQPVSAGQADEEFCSEFLSREPSEPVLPTLRHSARRRLYVAAERRAVGQRWRGHRLQGGPQISLWRKLNAERSTTASKSKQDNAARSFSARLAAFPAQAFMNATLITGRSALQ